MDGPHDLGGAHGMGPIGPEPEADEPRFHSEWEKRALALTLAAASLGRWNLDMIRHARERQHPLDYLRNSYYENWLVGLETLLVEKGVTTPDELATGISAGPGSESLRASVPGPKRMRELMLQGSSFQREPDAPPLYAPGDRVRAYIYDVREELRGPQIFLSRSHPQFMAKLFSQEVPEIYDGIIEIKAVARDPGSRAKIAVISHDGSIDPVGACVGMRGSRVQAVVNELQGEKIDIIPWNEDVPTFLVNALQPAEVSKVVLDEEERRVEVVVADDGSSDHTEPVVQEFQEKAPFPIRHIWHEDDGHRRAATLQRLCATPVGKREHEHEGDLQRSERSRPDVGQLEGHGNQRSEG